MTLDSSAPVKALAIAWILLPLVAAFVLSRLAQRDLVPIVQESWVSLRVGAAVAGGWLLLGLGLVPFLGVHGSGLAKALLVALGWSAAAGAWLGPAVVELMFRPAPSDVGEPVDFMPIGHAKQMVKVSPTSGDAASARFLVPQVWWNEAYARGGNKPVKGRIYKGKQNLWFARFD
ncbi:MAG TPA: hypothetical protein VHM31_08990 [Polyangia bacterium]|nr:hypothetical protein [Polyangia bacterium]